MTGFTAASTTLLHVLVDGFEKNELIDGYTWRRLPLSDSVTARKKFLELAKEASQWLGEPHTVETTEARRFAKWDTLELFQAGAGLLLRVPDTGFADWWHEDSTWSHDPMKDVEEWVLQGTQHG